MSADSLLPPSSTVLERSLSLGDAKRLAAIASPHRTLWDPWTCPAAHLPWLAWGLSVDQWADGWSEQTKRQLIADSIAWHRRKGTPWAVRTALERLGFSNVEILESTNQRYDGSLSYDGAATYGIDLGPYEFDVILNDSVSEIQADAAAIRAQIDLAKNERSKLRNIIAYSLRYDGAHAYDGSEHYDGALVLV